MARRRSIAIVGAVAACCAAFALGRYSAPRATEIVRQGEQERVQTVEVYGQAEEWVTRRDSTSETHQVRVEEHAPVVTTWPDGRREERGPVTVRVETGTRATETEEGAGSSETTVTLTETVYVDRWLERTVEVKQRPDWLLGATVGGGSVGVLYGGQVSRRVLGPIYLQAGAMAGGGEWVVTAGVGVAW